MFKISILAVQRKSLEVIAGLNVDVSVCSQFQALEHLSCFTVLDVKHQACVCLWTVAFLKRIILKDANMKDFLGNIKCQCIKTWLTKSWRMHVYIISALRIPQINIKHVSIRFAFWPIAKPCSTLRKEFSATQTWIWLPSSGCAVELQNYFECQACFRSKWC